MKQFRLYWLDGKTEIVEGSDIADAYSQAGLGAGALKALDYYEEVVTPQTQERFGGCPFCQQTIVVFRRHGRWGMVYHVNQAGQVCEGSYGEPQGVTK